MPRAKPPKQLIDELPDAHRVKAKLADGSIKVYLYYRPSGEKMDPNDIMQSYARAEKNSGLRATRHTGYMGSGDPIQSPATKSPKKLGFKISASSRVVIGSTLFALASSGFLYLIPPSPTDRYLLRRAMLHYQGHAYLLPVKYFDVPLENAKLYEDDRLLGPSNTPQQEIIEKGEGRFWLYRDLSNYFGPALMFSTSDNTDPNTNGRKYHLR
ncbi:hypothetical protein V5279_25005 [Bradyrhizobium sp. 26S5]|uniref:hypothetical protein n=1 Tax=Bradyrhizobium sp. 26S5 TaxID=3139729 RepID=UPI0030CF16D9